MDPHWYVRQLNPLRRELVTVEANLRALLEASKDGKGASSAVNLDREEEGVTTEGQVSVLKARRDELLKRIDALEEQARHNEILPGELREETEEAVEGTSENSAVAAGGVSGEKSRVVRELEEALEAEKAHLADVNKEVDLLRRDQRLEEQKEFSNPESRSRRDPRSKLAEITSDLTGKQIEFEDSERRIAELEDRLENARRLSSIEARKEAASVGDLPDQVGDNHAEGSQNNEAFWRKQFSEIDYKARIAKKELDILQREHNVLLLQYYSNPATAMKESVTRKDVNNHRDAVEAKQRELTELRKQREDLEDALRHAGGPPAWAR
jgi:ribosomal protein S9